MGQEHPGSPSASFPSCLPPGKPPLQALLSPLQKCSRKQREPQNKTTTKAPGLPGNSSLHFLIFHARFLILRIDLQRVIDSRTIHFFSEKTFPSTEVWPFALTLHQTYTVWALVHLSNSEIFHLSNNLVNSSIQISYCQVPEMLLSVSPYLRNDSSHCDNGFTLPPGKSSEALTNSLSSANKPFKERGGLLMTSHQAGRNRNFHTDSNSIVWVMASYSNWRDPV